MTGIERLRAISGAWDEWGLGGTLTEIADQIERELARHDEPDSTDNGARLPYVTDEDREAVEWVRDHGGLDHVKAEWRSRVPYDRYERRRQRLLGHIAECEEALRRRNATISALEKTADLLRKQIADMRPRLVPEVDSWSRLEEDAKLSLCEYNLRHKPAVGDGTTLGEDVRVDLVRRCKVLAERERGE